MTEVAPDAPEEEFPDWDALDKPEAGPRPDDVRANHVYTVSMKPGEPPMLTVRADTAADLNAAFRALEDNGVYLNLGAAAAMLRSMGAAGAGLGPATPMGTLPPPAAPPVHPAAAQVAQSYPTPPGGFPSGPPVPSPGPAPFGAAPAPAAVPAQGGWGAPAPTAVPPGWYAFKSPYKPEHEKQEWEGLKAQCPKDNLKWDKANKRWLVSPTYVGWFAKWNPQPAG